MIGTANASPSKIKGEKSMPELNRTEAKVINAVLDREPEYVRIVDREGRSLTFILADEIRPEENPVFLPTEEDRRSAS
jgi:hypothetical protein